MLGLPHVIKNNNIKKKQLKIVSDANRQTNRQQQHVYCNLWTCACNVIFCIKI